MVALPNFMPGQDVRAARDVARPSRLGGVEIRSGCAELVMVVTVCGEIDASNIDRVSVCMTHFVSTGSALLIDLSGVDFFAARGAVLLAAIDAECRRRELPWMVVGSHAVNRVLRIVDDGRKFPRSTSVAQAMRHLADLSQNPAHAPGDLVVQERDMWSQSS